MEKPLQGIRRSKGRRILLILGPAVAAAILAGTGRGQADKRAAPPHFDYSVQVVDGSPLVEVRITGLGARPDLGFAADERILGIRNLRFADADGPVPHHTSIETVSPARKAVRRWHRLGRTVRSLTASFEIHPPPEFKSNGDGRRFGAAGSTTVLGGIHLILLPRTGPCGTGSMRFPAESIGCGSWAYRNDESMRGLLDRRFAIGSVPTATMGGWTLHVDRSYDRETRARFESEFRILFEEVRTRVGWWTDLPWQLVVAPRAPDTIRVAEMSAADFVFLDADRPYPRFWGEALHDWTVARTRSDWFQLGLARLAGAAVARRLAPELPDPVDEIATFASAERVGFDVDLTGPLPSDQAVELASGVRSYKSVLVLTLVHEALMKAGIADGIWEAARRLPGQADPFEALAQVGGLRLGHRVRTWCGPSGFPFRKAPGFRFEPSPNPPMQADLTLCFSGSGKGELESCGCAVGMAGGLARRATVLKSIPGPKVSIDLGNSLSLREGRHLTEDDEAEQRKYIELLEKAGTDLQVPGTAELARGRAFFCRVSADRRCAFTGATAPADLLSPSFVLRRGALRIAVVGFTESCMDPFKYRTFGDVPDPCHLVADLERLGRTLDTVRDADLVVVAGWITPQSLREVVDRFGDRVDVILNDNPAAREGAAVLERRTLGGYVGRTLVLFHTLEGKGITVARLRLPAAHRVTEFDARTVVLDDSIAEDPAIRGAVSAFYEESARRELAAAGGARPLIEWDHAFQGRFVGTDRCVTCHADQARQHHVTRHALAFNTLIRAGRQMTTRCTPCHVVGFALPSGWNPVAPVERLRHVGCESCHGAGGDHADDPRRNTIRRTPLKETCLSCHDPKHSPDFESTFERRWNSVRH